jgi:hypothetical protein
LRAKNSKVAGAHFIPKSCYTLAHALYEVEMLEEVYETATNGGMSTIQVNSSRDQHVMTEIAHLSDKGPYCGMGVPDPATWTLCKHTLDCKRAVVYVQTFKKENVDRVFYFQARLLTEALKLKVR